MGNSLDVAKSAVLGYMRRLIGYTQLHSRLDGVDERLRGIDKRITGTDSASSMLELASTLRSVDEKLSRIEARAGGGLAKGTASVSEEHKLANLDAIKAALQELQTRVDSIEQAEKTTHYLLSALDAKANRFAASATDNMADLVELTVRNSVPQPLNIRVSTERPVAIDSPDHLHPWGTKNDNTRHPRFVRRCEQLFSSIVHLDVGCAGGGLVWDFTLRGHVSVGIEGSDYSLREQRAEWRIIPDRLFTADICSPFSLVAGDGARLLFNLVTAWELFEHIPTDKVSDTVSNLVDNMQHDALLVCSIAMTRDEDAATGAVYHQTIKPKDWWLDQFQRHGLVEQNGLFDVSDFVRGSGNPRSFDWDVRTDAAVGFHLVLSRGNPMAKSFSELSGVA